MRGRLDASDEPRYRARIHVTSKQARLAAAASIAAIVSFLQPNIWAIFAAKMDPHIQFDVARS
jgi:hypothetical protein